MSGIIRPRSSQPAEPLWTDPGIKSKISVRELISTSKKKKKKAQAGNESSNILPKFSHERKQPKPPNGTFVSMERPGIAPKGLRQRFKDGSVVGSAAGCRELGKLGL